MAHTARVGAYVGVIAAASMAIAPAQAAAASTHDTAGYATAALASINADGAFEGQLGSSSYDEQADTAEWRGRRWYGRRGWRRDRIDGGDVLAGVLVLGGIAAIASAASNNRRRERDVVVVERQRNTVRYDDRRYDDRRANPRASNGSGIDSAVSQCLTEIERDVRVDSVDGARRLAQGWVVSGTLFNGAGFTCQIGNDGRISDIDYGGGFQGSADGTGVYSSDYTSDYTSDYASDYASADGQLSDVRYADARAAMGANVYRVPDETGEPLPAYPGGPLPGEAEWSDGAVEP
ncbi:hypothetical protein [Qipengyuania sp. ASV99]|uniref:hypothetical protein n=1 Tax=Qipengyuania sp. ASV99 TaxID=3399681 RepID=UPI003A4C7F96